MDWKSEIGNVFPENIIKEKQKVYVTTLQGNSQESKLWYTGKHNIAEEINRIHGLDTIKNYRPGRYRR